MTITAEEKLPDEVQLVFDNWDILLRVSSDSAKYRELSEGILVNTQEFAAIVNKAWELANRYRALLSKKRIKKEELQTLLRQIQQYNIEIMHFISSNSLQTDYDEAKAKLEEKRREEMKKTEEPAESASVEAQTAEEIPEGFTKEEWANMSGQERKDWIKLSDEVAS